MENKEIIILSVIIILLLFIIYQYYKLRKSKETIIALSSQLQNLKMQSLYNFNNDITFLSYIVGFKCKVYSDLILNPTTELSNTKILKGEDQVKAVNEIVLSVMSTLSDEYKQVLFKYFTDSSLKEYITELVLNHITSVINELNKTKFKKFVRSEVKNEDLTFSKKDIE